MSSRESLQLFSWPIGHLAQANANILKRPPHVPERAVTGIVSTRRSWAVGCTYIVSPRVQTFPCLQRVATLGID